MALRKLRVFLSSPGDVGLERNLATGVLERLQGEFAARVELNVIRWEHEPVLATSTFQDQIIPPSQTDIVVCILWSRLGTRLPENYRREDGTPYASGTEWEFEDAARSYRERQMPDLLVYRKLDEPVASLKDTERLEELRRQWAALEAFTRRWFEGADGSFKAAFKTFKGPDQFETLLEVDLRKLIVEHLPASATEEGEAAAAVRWHRGSPFRGLEAFDAEHAPVFFGRTRAIGEIKDRLVRQAAEGRAFVLVFGMSGGGKSSLVRAGVLPSLAQPGVIEGVGLWRTCVFRPSDAPGDLCEGLARALLGPGALPELAAAGVDAARLASMLREAPKHAVVPLGMALARAQENTVAAAGLPAPRFGPRLALAIDQMEEMFTLERVDAGQREAFVAVLSELARSGLVWVVGTMRSDFYPRCAELPELLTLKEGAGQYDLTPPTFAEIAQIITYPARAAGLLFEKDPKSGDTVDRRIHEAASRDPEALPLLEFTLDQLYLHRTDDQVLTFAAYESLGGLEGALARHAEQAYQRLRPEEQAAFSSVFGALVTVRQDDETLAAAQRVPRASLEATGGCKAMVDAFIAARLLVTDRAGDGRPDVRLAHEALLRRWPRLRSWLEEDIDFLRIRARVIAAEARWRREGRRADLLLPAGKPLAEAEDILSRRRDDLAAGLAEYIEASTRRRVGRRRINTAISMAVAAAFTAVVLVSYFQWRKWQGEKALAAIETARREREADRKKAEAEKEKLQARKEEQLARETEQRNHKFNFESMAYSASWDAKKRPKDALALYQQALDLALRLARDPFEPADQWNARAAKMYRGMAEVYGALNDPAKQHEALQSAQALYDKLPKDVATPQVRQELQVELEIATEHLAALLMQNSLLKEALAARSLEGGLIGASAAPPAVVDEERRNGLLANLRLQEGRVKFHRSIDGVRDLARSYGQYGRFLLDARDPKGAAEAFGSAVKLDLQAIAEAPMALDDRFNLSAHYEDQGLALRDASDLKGALAVWKAMRDHSEALLEPAGKDEPQGGKAKARPFLSDTNTERVRKSLGATYRRMGEVQLALGDHDAARESFAKAAVMPARVAQLRLADARADAAIGLEEAGRLSRRAGDEAAARRSLDEARVLIDASVADPEGREALRSRLTTIEQDGRIMARAGRWIEALWRIELVADNRPRIARKDSLDDQAMLAATYADLAAIRSKLGDRPKALEAVALCRTVVAALVPLPTKLNNRDDTTRAELKRRVVERLLNIADALKQAGDVVADLGDARGGAEVYRETLAYLGGVTGHEALQGLGERAEVQRRIGDLDARLGDTAGARAAYEKRSALEIEAAQQAEAGVARWTALAAAYGKLAEMRRRMGDARAAHDADEEASAAEIAAARARPGNDGKVDLINLSRNLGLRRRSAGDLAGARAALEESLAVFKTLGPPPTGSQNWSFLIGLHADTAEAALALNDRERAGRLGLDAMAVAIPTLEGGKLPVDLRRALRTGYFRIGQLFTALGDRDRALEADRKGLDHIVRVARSPAATPNDQRDVASSHEAIAAVEQAKGDFAAAARSLDESLAVRKTLAAQESDPSIAAGPFGVYLKIAALRGAASDQGGAMNALAEARSACERMAQSGESLPLLRTLGDCYERLGSAYHARRDNAAAVEAGQHAVETYRKAAQASGEPRDRSALSGACLSLGWFQLFDRQFREAEESSREGLKADPNRVILYTNLAHALLFQGRGDEAEAIYRKYQDVKINDRQTFSAGILEDFQAFRERGLEHPGMAAIERLMKPGGK